MEIIAIIIRNIVALLLLASLLELLLPEGGVSRFIRLAIGLLLLAAVITPLSSGLTFDWEKMTDMDDVATAAADYIEQGNELNSRLYDVATVEYKAELNTQLESLAQLADGVSIAQAEVTLSDSGELTAVTLTVIGDGTQDSVTLATGVKTLISGFYLLEDEQVRCIIKEDRTDNGK